MMVVDGWYSERELDALREAVKEAPGRDFVEVGVYRGLSAWVISENLSEFDTLHLVDNLSMPGANPKHWPSGETYTDGTLPDIQDIGFLHHDADHTEDVVYAQLMYFLPRMAINGIIAMHDFGPTYPGVQLGFERACRDSKVEVKKLYQVETLAVFRVSCHSGSVITTDEDECYQLKKDSD